MHFLIYPLQFTKVKLLGVALCAKAVTLPVMEEPLRKIKTNNIGDWYNNLTESEKANFHAVRKEKKKATEDRKRKLLEEARAKATELLPEILANDLLLAENDNYTPLPRTIEKLKDLLNSGMTIESMRKKFNGVSDKSWEKITRFIFKNQVHHVEDIGLDIITVKKRALDMLGRRIKTLKREIRNAKKPDKDGGKKKQAPVSLLNLLANAEDEYMKIELDVAKVLHGIGAVGEKSKAASIHVHLATPRPQPTPQKDVTPKKSLAEMMSSGPSD